MPVIRAILFDADGVLQRATDDLNTRLEASLGFVPEPLDAFLHEVFAAERPCLIGEADFARTLEQVVERWNAPRAAAQRLATWWCSIEVDHALLSLAGELRRRGYLCGLATNQNALRANVMAHELGFGALFDRCFFSCELGCAKPDARYFAAVTEALALPPAEILFVDDAERNVESARAAGMHAERFVNPWSADALPQMSALLARFGVTS